MLGASGTDKKDKIAFGNAIALCVKYKLPVIFDYGRILSKKSEKSVFTNRAFDVADACITTSIAEGFGYGFYEPWLHGKVVFGRKYIEFEPVAGIKFDGMYDSLPIPIKWISISALRDRYWRIMRNCFGVLKNNTLLLNRKKFDRSFSDYFVKDDKIDFGCLDVPMQFEIVESLLKSPGKLDEWESACGIQLQKIRRSIDNTLYGSVKTIRYNQNRIKKYLSLKWFSREFSYSLSQNPFKNVKTRRREAIVREFCAFNRFRLLLTK
jgi:hypothetical protein